MGFCVEIYRAQNTAYASIKSCSACIRSVSRSGDVKNYRAVITINIHKAGVTLTGALGTIKAASPIQQTTDNIGYPNINNEAK